MTTTHSGDWDLRGMDFETYLVGPVTEKIIDADRLVRQEWSNGFPNWEMYRSALAGDTHVRRDLRTWCVAYAVAAAESGVIRKGKPTEEMGVLAGWDCYYALHHHRWVVAGQDIADVAGVKSDTYRKLRNYVYRALRSSLDEYFVRMQVAVRQVWMQDRFIGDSRPAAIWRPCMQPDGLPERAYSSDGNGNYWARPLQPGDS